MFIRIKFYLSLVSFAVHWAPQGLGSTGLSPHLPPTAAAGCHCPARVGTGRASGPGARGGARAGLTQARTQTPPGWVGHRELYLLGVIATVSSRRHRSHWATSPTERHRPGSTCNKPTRPQPELHSRLAGSRTSWPVTAGPVLRPHAAPLPSPPAPPHPLLLLNKCAPCCPGVAEAVSVRRLRLREPFVHEMLQHPVGAWGVGAWCHSPQKTVVQTWGSCLANTRPLPGSSLNLGPRAPNSYLLGGAWERGWGVDCPAEGVPPRTCHFTTDLGFTPLLETMQTLIQKVQVQ